MKKIGFLLIFLLLIKSDISFAAAAAVGSSSDYKETYLRGMLPEEQAKMIYNKIKDFSPREGTSLVFSEDYHITLKKFSISSKAMRTMGTFSRTHLGKEKSAGKGHHRDTLRKKMCKVLSEVIKIEFIISGYSADFGKFGVVTLTPEADESVDITYLEENPHISIIKSEEEGGYDERMKVSPLYDDLIEKKVKINSICTDKAKGDPITCVSVERCRSSTPDLFD